MRNPGLLRLLLPVALVCWVAYSAPASERQFNVVFILSDNQSYYEMGCHGHEVIKTPNIDRFAGESLDFRKFYAPPYCSPSRAVILTGQYAMRSGVHNTIGGRSILHREKTTLADVLVKNGYRTGVFGKWHLGFSFPYRPQDRGFEEVFVHGGGGVGQLEDYFGNSHYDTTFIHNGKVSPSRGFSTDTLFEQAMAFVEKHKDEKFFCYVPTPVTHSPHYGPRDLVEKMKAEGIKGDIGLFAQVQNLDTNVGRMLEKIDELGLRDNTIVIYASDQGMSDRGSPEGGNRKGVPFDSSHHVPFMVRIPGGNTGVCERLAGMIDFFPTIVDLCDLKSPVEVDGLSLRPLLFGEKGYPDDRTLIIQCPRGREAAKWKNASVKTDRWRLVDGKELFDAKADPRQNMDVADDHPEVVAALREKYEAFWSDLPDQSTTLSRHLLGADECPEVVLNGMDWYVGGAPWHSGHFNGIKGGNGAWAVTVQKDGRYVIECRHFPREADRAMGATRARLKIGEVVKELELKESDRSVRFEVDLKAGDYDLETTMTVKGGSRGALFVYISKDE